MPDKKISKNKRTWHKKECDVEVEAAATSTSNIENNGIYKNTLYIYKDKTTTRITYDICSDEYVIVYSNN